MVQALEWLDLGDENDQVVGQIARDDAWAQRRAVRVVNAFLVHRRGELWIPRRTASKRMFSGGLDVGDRCFT